MLYSICRVKHAAPEFALHPARNICLPHEHDETCENKCARGRLERERCTRFPINSANCCRVSLFLAEFIDLGRWSDDYRQNRLLGLAATRLPLGESVLIVWYDNFFRNDEVAWTGFGFSLDNWDEGLAWFWSAVENKSLRNTRLSMRPARADSNIVENRIGQRKVHLITYAWKSFILYNTF